MKILSSEQLREIDKYTIEHDDVTPLDLVKRVGEGVAYEVQTRWNTDKRIVVFAGWGNNGADALATADILIERNYSPEVYIFNIGGNMLRPECKAMRDIIVDKIDPKKLFEIVNSFNMPELDSDCVIIDGMFGSGLNKPLNGAFQSVVREINDSNAFIVSIDIPSGLYGEWNEHAINRNIIHADLTLAIQLPRISFLMPETAKLVGDWKVLNIGLSREAIRKAQHSFYLIEREDVRHLLRRRDPFASKADFGNALICAGSHGMMGAAVLAAKGCLRAGVGRLTCYIPRCGYSILQTAVPCACCSTDRDSDKITRIEMQHNFSAVAIGPGLGTHDATINTLEDFLKTAQANSRPVILDADAVRCIAQRPTMLDYIPALSVLTPHAGEFDLLFGQHPSTEARIKKAIDKAHLYRVFIVLKGRYTAVVRPDGKVYFNSSGTPAMATPGSGDVLTGVICGLMAQGIKPEMATVIATYVHGLAGEIAAERHGTYGVTADDIANAIGEAIKSVMN